MSVNAQVLSTSEMQAVKSDRLKIGLALLAVYIIWGSTYLAARVAVETIPAFMMTSVRFLMAGGAMYIFLRARGVPNPTREEWRNAFLTGAVMLGAGTGGVAFAEQQGVASGLAALAVAAMPLWAGLFSGLWGQWPGRREWMGIFVGLVGVALLNMEHGMQSNTIGAISVILAPMGWALASIWSKHVRLPGGLMTTAIQMMGGFVATGVISLLIGEHLTTMPTTRSILALLYLVTFGAMVAFSAYTYLLQKVRSTLATSYAYVNPVVAVFLGVLLINEHITILGIGAMIVILTGVALVALSKAKKA
ncbi:MAG: drug/metabolite exporter YedA [Anaerolineae bacterium]